MTGPEDPAAAGRDQVRVGHAERERVIEALKDAFVQDRLTRDELDERAGGALAANVLDPNGADDPYHHWSVLCLYVAFFAVVTAFGIMINGVGTAVEQRRERKQAG